MIDTGMKGKDNIKIKPPKGKSQKTKIRTVKQLK
jgi:hypothetical protein